MNSLKLIGYAPYMAKTISEQTMSIVIDDRRTKKIALKEILIIVGIVKVIIFSIDSLLILY